MFIPKRVFFEKDSLHYPLGRELFDHFSALGIPVHYTTSHNRVTGLPSDTPRRAYVEAKATLVVGVRRSKDFQTSKPSADYALPLATGCPGLCQYCYLQTTLGPRPYVRVYVNRDQILARAEQYIRERAPLETTFEGACTSDPVAVEPYTKSLAAAVDFFSRQDKGRFRFVTKDPAIESLLGVEHRGHTEARFSISTRYVAETFEAGVASAEDRLNAARNLFEAGYPLGFLIAPIMIYPQWKEEIRELLEQVTAAAPWKPFFEIVSHRFTARAKRLILQRHPGTKLPMDEEEREFRYGQFGYGKYLYPRVRRKEIEDLFQEEVRRLLPGSEIRYVV